MKYSGRIVAALLALLMIAGSCFPALADYDDGMDCPECGKYHWDDWIACDDCGMCIDCAADYTCPYCGACTYCAGDQCNGCGACPDCGEIICSECESQCFKCADDSKFCITCGRCGECNGETACPGCTETCGECEARDFCSECFFCEDCSGGVCTECGKACYNCADEDEFCQACGRCGECNGNTVCPGCHENCGECESKDFCSECFYCEDCGEMICTECGKACFNCSSDAEFCISCGRCGDCNGNTTCPGCREICGECGAKDQCGDCLYCEDCVDYICENCGDTCTNCADESEFCDNCGLCPDCNGGTTCPYCGETCAECSNFNQCQVCFACEDCTILCDGCMDICVDCADGWCQSCGLCGDCNGGTACPGCGETCMECNKYGQCYDCYTCEQCTTICVECGEVCIDCADSFCTNCSTCSDCNGDSVCPNCGETCALCKNYAQCEECNTCENCVLLCSDCGEVCMECAADGWCFGCATCADCNGGTACPDCGESCLECETREQCDSCYLCADCTTVCTDCGDVCIDCADGWCGNCNTCGDCNGDTVCPGCGDTCESCNNKAQCAECFTCEECAVLCSVCGEYCSACDILFNDETQLCHNCDVHDVDVAAVITRINNIGTVAYTPECRAKLESATVAFNALTTEQQSQVTNVNTLRSAGRQYNALKKEADTKAAQDVMMKISKIGTVEPTVACRIKIGNARNAYNLLTDEQKALVLNYTTLTQAQTTYDALKASADDAALTAAISRIGAIGKVTYTPESKAKIDAARSAYNVLTAAQKALVANYNVLTAAETQYAALKAAADQAQADQTAANAVIARIQSIGTVKYTDACGLKIDAARAAYDALTAAQKTLVGNYAVLTAAETKYAALKAAADQSAADQTAANAASDKISAIGKVEYTAACKEKIDTARAAYNALTAAQKALVTNDAVLTAAEAKYAELKTAADQAAVNAVIAKIKSIGTVLLNDYCKARIDAARSAYNALPAALKTQVTNYDVLTAAESDYAGLKTAAEQAQADKAAAEQAAVNEAIAKINAIGTVEYTPESKTKINEASIAYNALSADQKAQVTNYAVLTDAETQYSALKAEAEKPKVVRSVSLADPEKTLRFRKSVELNLTVDADEGAVEKIVFSSSDEKIAKVNDKGVVTGCVKNGTAVITCTVTDKDGKPIEATCTVTVKTLWWEWLIIILLFGWLWY